MSVNISSICDQIFPLLRETADAAGLKEVMVDVVTDFTTNTIWGSVGERRAELASRQEITDSTYREVLFDRVRLLVKNARNDSP